MSEAIHGSYAPSTLLRYNQCWREFAEFRTRYGLPNLWPVTHKQYYLYVGYLCNKGKSAGAIRSVLAALAWKHKVSYAPDHSKSFLISRALIGIAKHPHDSTKKLPIRFELLKRILKLVPRVAKSSFEVALTRAVFAMAYYGCCRIGELVESGSLQHTLKLANIDQRLDRDPPEMTFLLASAKHAKSAAKFRLTKFSDPSCCAVSLLTHYLSLRPVGGECCFVLKSGVPVKRDLIARTLSDCLRQAGLDPVSYSPHSFRAGRATDLAAAGYPDLKFQAAGRWASKAYRNYRKIRWP